jgi:recombination protein RecT
MSNAPTNQTKALSPVDEFRSGITVLESQIKAALPSHVTVEKFTRAVMTAVQGNPELLSTDRKSLYAACMKSAADGLLPDGREAVILPYRTKGALVAQYQPMVQGVLKKIRNSGDLANISPNIVCKNDEFEFWIDETGEHLKHKPCLTGPRGELTHAYCVARTKDGSVYTEVMSRLEIDQVRDSSPGKGQSGPWQNWYGEMAKKTVIRRLSKRLPMSTDIEGVPEDEAEDFIDVTPQASPTAAAPAAKPASASKATRLEKMLGNRVAPGVTEVALPDADQLEIERTHHA